MPRDLAYACAAMTCLAAHKAAGLAMLLSHDCWLRIGEVSAVCVRNVADTRAQADPVGRGVSSYASSYPLRRVGDRFHNTPESIMSGAPWVIKNETIMKKVHEGPIS